MLKLIKGIFTGDDEREIKRLFKTVETVNGLEPEYEKLTNEQLREKTSQFRQRLSPKQRHQHRIKA